MSNRSSYVKAEPVSDEEQESIISNKGIKTEPADDQNIFPVSTTIKQEGICIKNEPTNIDILLGSLLEVASIKDIQHKVFMASDPSRQYTAVTTLVRNSFPKFSAQAMAHEIVMDPEFQSGLSKYSKYYTDPNVNQATSYRQPSGEALAEAEQKIMREWEEKGRESLQEIKNFNTLVKLFYHGSHAQSVDLNALKLVNVKVWQQFLNFNRSISNKYIPLVSEYDIRDFHECIVGSVHMIYKSLIRPGSIVLCDWIITSDTDLQGNKSHKLGLGPLSDVQQSKFSERSLKLNLYRHIIEKPENHHNVMISEMYLVHFNPDGGDFKMHLIGRQTDDLIKRVIDYTKNVFKKRRNYSSAAGCSNWKRSRY